MKKLTAVEWLWEQIDNAIPFQNIQKSQIFNGLLEQAKELEKEQIVDAYVECWMQDGGNGNHKTKEAEDYYNETFSNGK